MRAARLLVRSFANVVSAVLVAGAVLAGLIGDWLTSLAIVVSVVLSGVLGFAMEYRADRALLALRSLRPLTVAVRRDGGVEVIPVDALQLGDNLLLKAGTRIAADGTLTESEGMEVDESALTGESTPLEKETGASIFAGTLITRGSGEATVQAVGAQTRFGEIEESLGTIEREPTPMEVQLARLGRWLIGVFFAVCAVVTLLGTLMGHELRVMVETGIALAVAAIPEGLPAVAAVTLAIGTHRLARRGAIVRQLDAVEALGAVTVIASDKTGTVTEGRMRVTTIALADGRSVHVDGRGLGLQAEFTEKLLVVDPLLDAATHRLLAAALLCNDALLHQNPTGGWEVHGDFTDAALFAAAIAAGLSRDEMERRLPRTAVTAFTREQRFMETRHTGADGSYGACKGAPEVVLNRCSHVLTGGGEQPLTALLRETLLATNHTVAREGLRVVAIADQPPSASGLVFLGLVGIADNLRPEATAAVAAARAAGVTVILVSGDQVATTAAIAQRLGLGTDAVDASLRWDPALAASGSASVFARMAPLQKLELVQALTAAGEVVAVTGDGVNDAPALRAAHVGVAMGVRGTDAAREAADVVLTDDNFATIVVAIEEGRRIFRSLQLALRYLLTASWATIGVITAAIALGQDPPLTAFQILWLNLVIHIFPAIALAASEGTGTEMQAKPGAFSGPLADRSLVVSVVLRAAVVAGATVVAIFIGDATGDAAHVQSLAYMTLALAMLASATVLGDRRLSQAALLRRPLAAAELVSLLLLVLGVYGPLAEKVGSDGANLVEWALTLGLATASTALIALIEFARVASRPSPEARDTKRTHATGVDSAGELTPRR